MRLVFCVLSVIVIPSLLPSAEAEWRSTSVKKELGALREIFMDAIDKYGNVYETITANCPKCEEGKECEDNCLTKQLMKFEERLRRLLSVISKLEKLACHECPGYFWTDSVVPSSGWTSPNTNPVVMAPSRRNPLLTDMIGKLSTATMKNQLSGILGSLKSIMVATNSHLYREQPETVTVLQGQPRAITFDRSREEVYVAEIMSDNSVQITGRNVTSGEVTNQVKTYVANSQQPVALAMDGSQLVVQLTDDAFSSIEIINIDNGESNVFPAVNRRGRRITVDTDSRVIYYTSNDGVYQFNMTSGNTVQISQDTNAVGIVYDYTAKRVYYCHSDNGDISSYDTLTKSTTTEAKNNLGCSDMSIHYVIDTFGSHPLQKKLHIFVASDTKNEVTEYLPGEAVGDPRMRELFSPDGGTSMTLIT